MTPARSYSTSRVLSAVCAGWLAVMCLPAFARPSCTFASSAPVDFGTYSVFSTLPNNSGIGSIRIHCQGGGGPFKVTLSTGQSNSFASRQLRNGPNSLQYNLYTTAARSTVWGDGTGGSSVQYATRNTDSKLDIFGQMPALQDAAVGTYRDNIVAIVNF